MFVMVVGNDYAYICFMIENKSHFLIPIKLLSLEVWSKCQYILFLLLIDNTKTWKKEKRSIIPKIEYCNYFFMIFSSLGKTFNILKI